jgi:hypothetical protein
MKKETKTASTVFHDKLLKNMNQNILEIIGNFILILLMQYKKIFTKKRFAYFRCWRGNRILV